MSDETTEQAKPKKIVAPVLSSAELEQGVWATKAALDKQKKYSVRIRKDADPKSPNYETVQVNGYTYTIMKGQDVMVPETVRDILTESGII